LQGERRNRISREKADEMIQSFEGLQIRLEAIDWGEMLPLARRFDRSAYAASHLALAESSGEPFITGDKRLYNAVHAELNWVQWIGDYS
jgi:predicted nucleic acid-binding protein